MLQASKAINVQKWFKKPYQNLKKDLVFSTKENFKFKKLLTYNDFAVFVVLRFTISLVVTSSLSAL